jgi:protein-S-isoprenylcysteine O-methyltransferase Ste14
MDRGTILRVWAPLIAGIWVLLTIFTLGPGRRGEARWVGLFIALIALAGVILARYTLGQSFSIKAKARALVTTGIYSRIRNPIYVSGVVLLLGIAIMIGRYELLWFLAVLIPIQIWRARNEARVLEEKFGEEYREYRKRTWF